MFGHHAGGMRTGKGSHEIVDGLWAIVLLQGAIILTTTVEAFVGGLSLGSIAAAGPVVLLTFSGAVLALVSARGLRLRRRWAMRTTVVAESLLLVMGLVGVGLSVLMDAQPGLVSILTTFVMPAAVLILVVRSSSMFVPKGT